MDLYLRRLKKCFLKALTLFLILSMTFGLLDVVRPVRVQAEASYLLSLNRPAYASSTEASLTPDRAFDGDTNTANSRWGSAHGIDPQWIYVDLGAVASIDRIVFYWQNSHSVAYEIQVSNDEASWTTIYSTANGTGNVEDIAVSGTGRYVRMYSTQRKTQYGVSLFEFQVYGTGGVNEPPAPLGPNVALDRPAFASSSLAGQSPALAVDGVSSTNWSSAASDDQWFYVDLGSIRTLGRIIVNWRNAARTFDIEVSDDAGNWTTVFRYMNSNGDPLNLPIYAAGRYVRVKGIVALTNSGYSISEFQVYDYAEGDPQPSYAIEPLREIASVSIGQGGYVTNDLSIREPRHPHYKSDQIAAPLPSNGWWQSIMVDKLGDAVVTLPLKSAYMRQGLGVLTPGAGYIRSNGNVQEAGGNPDFYLMANNIAPAAMANKVTGYGDWSVDVVLSDNETDKMTTTFVKGSPYLFSEFSDPATPELFLPAATRFFDRNNQTLLLTDGDSITADHIGLEITNGNGAPSPSLETRYYGVFAPPGTVFTKAGAKLKIHLGDSQHYLSLAAMPDRMNLSDFHQHAYAFVTDTKAVYDYNETTSEVITHFEVSTILKRPGFGDTTYMALLPHQWKVSATPITSLTYPSIRGQLKLTEGNSFTTVDRFHGIVPQFTEPDGAAYSRQTLLEYLNWLDSEMSGNIMERGGYSQGKKLQPLAMGVLMADQLGEDDIRNEFLSRLKTILADWYTYTPGEPSHYFNYNAEWGTMYYKHSDNFTNSANLTDHHFTYGYFIFSSAILAAYDNDFMDQYGDMVEHLLRDYASPSRQDPKFPYFRNFDHYEGHSWAGGYGNSVNGNNQEAAAEALFSWAGQYLWGLVTGNKEFRDAGIYGFTTELKAIEQYWFNYDQDNWLPGYNHKTAGIVYGSAIHFTTYFSNSPHHIYGIHWLPTAEYLTSYGFDQAKAGALYNGMMTDNGGAETGWYHTIWAFQSLSDAQGVLNKWNTTNMQRDAAANTYWFVHSMASLGHRTKEIWGSGNAGVTVYKNGIGYQAIVWNPSDSPVIITFRNAAGVTGNAIVAAQSHVKVDPTKYEVPNTGGPGNPDNPDTGTPAPQPPIAAIPPELPLEEEGQGQDEDSAQDEAADYSTPEQQPKFSDVPSTHWAYRALQLLASKQIVTGITESEFKPDASTTRAEFVTMLVRVLGLDAVGAKTPFTDVLATDWYAANVAAAFKFGLINGVSNDEFAPKAQITREQMASLIVRAYEFAFGEAIISEDAISGLKDGSQISPWARQDVNKAIALGLMRGQGDRRFAPEANATRAETAQAIMNLLNKLDDTGF